ncbi:hypothetical protein PDE_06390 [Penicillium oxalicum 114-2]|uniref:Uncharacterized protein n=1 Tax=Penicillium oxalicum (strain 114-2 / CGMCC 5302) TaxID=933388 RepID=S7ZLD0_PENO1|nr:hypothetical protein PDE_06390 [Penicillium oxalicum 114-2]
MPGQIPALADALTPAPSSLSFSLEDSLHRQLCFVSKNSDLEMAPIELIDTMTGMLLYRPPRISTHHSSKAGDF